MGITERSSHSIASTVYKTLAGRYPWALERIDSSHFIWKGSTTWKVAAPPPARTPSPAQTTTVYERLAELKDDSVLIRDEDGDLWLARRLET
jgi:hypothetical protein